MPSSDDELIVLQPLKSVRKLPPAGTKALVSVCANKQKVREIGEGVYASGTHRGKTWLRVPFIVTEGEYEGLWATFWLTINPDSYGFRSVYRLVTGSDEPVTRAQLKALLLESSWEVEIGPELQRDKVTQKVQETGRAAVKRLLGRAPDAAASGSDETLLLTP